MTSPLVPVEHVRRVHVRRARRADGRRICPFCFFNLLSPILDVVYGFLGFKVPQIPPSADAPAEEATTPSIATE